MRTSMQIIFTGIWSCESFPMSGPRPKDRMMTTTPKLQNPKNSKIPKPLELQNPKIPKPPNPQSSKTPQNTKNSQTPKL